MMQSDLDKLNFMLTLHFVCLFSRIKSLIALSLVGQWDGGFSLDVKMCSYEH